MGFFFQRDYQRNSSHSSCYSGGARINHTTREKRGDFKDQRIRKREDYWKDYSSSNYLRKIESNERDASWNTFRKSRKAIV